jgi:hypothetical protein
VSVDAVVNPAFQELQPDLRSDHGRDVEKNAECISRRVPSEEQGRHRQLRWESPNKELEQCSVAQTPGRTPVSVMTSGTNAKHPIRIQK